MAKRTSASPRRMPGHAAIRTFWAPWLVGLGKFDSFDEVEEDDYCFACGNKAPLIRAHIAARVCGGSDEAANLHLLCHACHVGSELLEGAAYWDWFQWQSCMKLAMLAPLEIASVRRCMMQTTGGAAMLESVDHLAAAFSIPERLPA